MSLTPRASPRGKRVSLFVTCLVDMLFPDTGIAVVEILERLGVEVEVPPAQTCCGQPGFNAGYRAEARQVARQFLEAFAGAEVIVTPSGSCAAMVRHEYPALFAGDAVWQPRAERAASVTWELTEFIVDGLGVTDLGGRLATPQRIAFHDACHGLRVLGLGPQARALVENVENAEIVPLPDADVCCGFGGLFSVKMSSVSGAMLQNKVEAIQACDASCILTGDVSCGMHINGGLERQGSARRVRHVADVLAEALREGGDGG